MAATPDAALGRLPQAPPLWQSLLLGVSGGLVLSQAFPRTGLWWLALPALVLLLLSLRGRRGWSAVLMGFLGGLAFYLPLISWATLFLGPVPWLGLGALQASIFAVGSWAIAMGYRWWPWHAAGGWRWCLPVFIGSLWTLREVVASHWPYKGFAWGRVGQSQADGVFAELVSWVGVTGVGFLLAVLAAVLVEGFVGQRQRERPLHLAVAAVVLVVLALVPAWRLPVHGTVRVAGVQGGTEKAGYFKAGEPGEVLQANLDATRMIPAGDYDLVVWPETGAEWDPIVDPDVRRLMGDISRTFDAPIITGAVHRLGPETFVNSLSIWRGEEFLGRYDKRDPVPFGEYVPDRHIWERFAPSLVGMIQRGYAPGETPSVFDLGQLRVGVGICFDVVDDDLMREHVREGAQIIVYPTNNADFGRTSELDQQVTFARLRAMESGRSVVQVSSVGFTEAFGPDGRSLERLPIYTPGALVVDVPLATGTTPAMIVSRPLAGIVSGGGLLVLVALGTGTAIRGARKSS